MYKLVVVGGKLRGSEYTLKEGVNLIGSDSTCDIFFKEENLSKKHCKITLKDNSLFLEDLGSTNGTILNGSLLLQSALKKNDLIAIPGFIFKVLYKKDPIFTEQEKTLSLKEKIEILLNKYGYPVILAFNKDYEWRFVGLSFFLVFAFLGSFFSFFPVYKNIQYFLEQESVEKARQYIEEVSRRNSVYLANKRFEEIQVNFLDNKEGVLFYELFDKEGRILKPSFKMNTLTGDSFSLEAKEFFSKNTQDIFIKKISDQEFGVAQTLKAYNERIGKEEIVGFFALKILPSNLMMISSQEGIFFIKSFFINAFFGLIGLLLIYLLTKYHFSFVKTKVEEVLLESGKDLVYEYKIEEFNPVISLFNSLLTKIKSLEGQSPVEEDDKPYLDILENMIKLLERGYVVLNSSKLLYKMSSVVEDILGIRETGSYMQEFLPLLRDPGLSSKIGNLLEILSFSQGYVEDFYEIQGKNYLISIFSLKNHAGSDKAFLITFKNS